MKQGEEVITSGAREPGGPEGGDGPARIRLPYLDGLRAVAAVYVVMFHAIPGFAGHELGGVARLLLRGGLAFGHEAVAIFIVLSGYCLMLPVAQSSGAPLDFKSYLGRRAFRILPPYYLALGCSLAAIALLPSLRRTATGTIWDDSLPAFEPGPIVTHVLLIHNWMPDFAYRINGPLWSVASEWQIYFVFPLLLLPLWRRHGIAALLVSATLVSYLPYLLAKQASLVAVPWYVLCFAFGMGAASINFGSKATRFLPWGVIAGGLWLGCLAFGLLAARVWFQLKPLTDVLVGGAAAALLIHLTERARRARSGATRGPLLTLLESRPALAIGHLSYSLYLTHLPVVALCYFTLYDRGLSGLTLALATLLTSVPAALLVALLFHLPFERPFMTPPAALRSRPSARATARPSLER